jgi:hypothetical protein
MASSSLVPIGHRSGATPTAWETAKARFLEGLDPADVALFETATPENLLYTTSNIQRQDARDSKTRRTFARLAPLTNWFGTYGKVFDTYTQIYPVHLAPIWGSLRVTLVMASTHSKVLCTGGGCSCSDWHYSTTTW